MKANQTPLAWISEEWGNSLALAVTAFGGPQAIAEYAGEAASVAPGETLWWEQEVNLVDRPSIWVGFPAAIWRDLGTVCLESLGITSPEDAEIRDTFREVLVQSLSGLMSSLTELRDTEVVCAEGRFLDAAPDPSPETAAISVRLGDGPPMEVYICASAALLDVCAEDAGRGANSPSSVTQANGAGAKPVRGSKGNVSSVVCLHMPVSISFGQVYLTLEETLSLTSGCIIPLNRSASAPGELKVNRRALARGPIVESDGFYGITIEAFGGRDLAMKGRPLAGPAH